MKKQDIEEMDIVLNRAGYVLTVCAAFAIVVVMVLIFR